MFVKLNGKKKTLMCVCGTTALGDSNIYTLEKKKKLKSTVKIVYTSKTKSSKIRQKSVSFK